MRRTLLVGLLVLGASGCATVVGGNERALFYSASSGMDKDTVGSGWHWHLPWNHYVVYDLRWRSHQEALHIHTKNGLHMDIEVTAVVRPRPDEIYALDREVGPGFYQQVVKPALFAASRDATGQFDHLQIVSQTHTVERAIQAALIEHLKGQHLEVGEVAIGHFDLPPEVEAAANRQAASAQLLAAKEVDLRLAERDTEVDKARRRGTLEAEGLVKKLHGEQDLDDINRQLQIEEAKRKAERERVEAESEAVVTRAQAEAKATELKAAAESARVKAAAQNLTPAYVRLQSLELLARAMTAGNAKIMVVPIAKNGMPAFFTPFLNPFGALGGSADTLSSN